jgi:hypothetical protein
MKIFTLGAWICGIVAAVILLAGLVYMIFGTSLLGIRHFVNYFHVANSLLLMAILCVLAHQGCADKKA